ncbi:SDR family oxidoreductase [Georgenia sp. AZ-5]|uniref:SDR family oxidoreductase n=1 Tax=Georgenia sp. AZ-5 TaxID=3367526 RepID=UPI003754EF4C
MRTGPVVVITGASSGIGRATARRFARQGADVVLAARREEALASLVEECERKGGRAVAVPTDVTDGAAVDGLAELAVREFGRIDVWVNNAAVGAVAPFLDLPVEDFRRVLEVNVMGYVHGARAALRQMRRQGSGVLINVASIVAEVAQPYTSAYSVSKAAVRALGGSLRSELRLDGAKDIHVCTVLPASIDTPYYQQVANYTGQRIRPVPPLYTPQRVARAIVRLARSPRREVTIGTGGRGFVVQHKIAPRTADTVMAEMVDKRHVSAEAVTAPSTGNLYEPLGDPRTTRATGGWGGFRRTAARRAVRAAALAGAALAVVRASDATGAGGGRRRRRQRSMGRP